MFEKTFVQLCLEGKASVEDVDDFVDKWHETKAAESLAEFLGFTSEEYALWVEQPEAIAEIVANYRRPALSGGKPTR